VIVSPISSFPAEGIQTDSGRFDARAQAVARAEMEKQALAAKIESERSPAASESAAKASNSNVGSRLDTFA
jgi:hypothetical protein